MTLYDIVRFCHGFRWPWTALPCLFVWLFLTLSFTFHVWVHPKNTNKRNALLAYIYFFRIGGRLPHTMNTLFNYCGLDRVKSGYVSYLFENISSFLSFSAHDCVPICSMAVNTNVYVQLFVSQIDVGAEWSTQAHASTHIMSTLLNDALKIYIRHITRT